MGTTASNSSKKGNAVVAAPKVIRPDPDIGAQISVVVNKLAPPVGVGYSIHYVGDDLQNGKPGSEGMWLWFNNVQSKSDVGFVIDLENFARPKDPKSSKNKRKGGVLYRAKALEEPSFERFFRVAGRGSGDQAYKGFSSSQTSPIFEDSYYFQHRTHQVKKKEAAKDLVPNIVSKWRLYFKASIENGTLGRSEALGSGSCILETIAVGTVVTNWQEEERIINHIDSDGEITGHHNERRTLKHETQFVDMIEYRLVLNDKLWAEWAVPGDSVQRNDSEIVVIETPFFKTTVNSTSDFTTETLPGIDGPFALILSHLCCTEFSVEGVKRHIACATPSLPPITFVGWGSKDVNLTFGGRHFKVEA